MSTTSYNLMHIQKQKIFRQRLALCLLVLIAGIFTACGKDENRRSLGIDGYVYMAQETQGLSDELLHFSTSAMKVRSEYLYYKEQGSDQIRRLSLEELDGKSEIEGRIVFTPDIPPDCDTYKINDYAVGNNGDIYYCMQGYRYEREGDLLNWIPVDTTLLIRQTADRRRVYQLPVDVLDGNMNFLYHLAVDGQERAFLLTKNKIYIVDAEGNMIGSIPTEDYITDSVSSRDWYSQVALLEGEKGRIYFVAGLYTRNAPSIYEILADDGCRLESIEGLTVDQRDRLYGSPYGLLCTKTDGFLYQYSLADSSWHPLLRWVDGNAGSNASKVFQFTPEYLAACYGSTNGEELYLLTKTAVEKLPEREVLVLATLNPTSTLPQRVMEFNQSNDQYLLLLDIYEGDEAVSRLDAALVSSNPPDLLDTNSLDIVKYAEKQVLEDLSPYLDQSQAISREDFLPNLLEGYTINQRLCSIPSSFALSNTLMGRPSQIGSAASWTMADVMALTEKYPDCQLLDRNDFFSILSFCSRYILGEYVDWESGTCHFDSAEFRDLVQWIWEHSEESGTLPEGETYLPYANSPVPADILLVHSWIQSPASYALSILQMGGDVTTLAGFPTVDGHAFHPVTVSNEFCITASSQYKDAAWQFIEFFLVKEWNREDSSGLFPFPTHRESLLRIIEDEATPNYTRDEKGNIRLDDAGNPMMEAKMAQYDSYGVPTIYYYLEREHADALLEMIDHLDFSPVSDKEDTAFAIISEELEGWLSRDKSLEEATAIIQSRIQLMLDEDA